LPSGLCRAPTVLLREQIMPRSAAEPPPRRSTASRGTLSRISFDLVEEVLWSLHSNPETVSEQLAQPKDRAIPGEEAELGLSQSYVHGVFAGESPLERVRRRRS
jgi:hypothetical protein